MNTIRLAVADAPVSLADLDGHPVVPVSGPEEVRRLAEFARSLGACVHTMHKARPRPPRDEPRSGVVTSLCGAGLATAAMYADATLRRLAVAETVTELSAIEGLEVVFCRWSSVTVDLLRALARGRRRVCPGLICGDDEREIWETASMRLVAVLAGRPRDAGSIVQVVSFWQGARESVGPVTRLGARAAASDVRDALRQGAGVLGIACHSGGMEARVNSRLSLCSVPFSGRARDLQRAPYCRITGECVVHETSIDDAVTRGLLMSVADLKARILFLGCCYGLYMDRRVSDPAWGLAPHLVRGAMVGACVAHWSIVPTSVLEFDAFVRSAARDVTLGEAVWHHNQQPKVKAFGSYAVLFGDPRLAAASSAPLAAENASPAVAVDLADLDFLRQYLTAVSDECCDGVLRIKWTRAMTALCQLDTMITRTLGHPRALLDAEDAVRRALLDFWATRGTRLQHGWIKFGDDYAGGTPEVCRACGESCDATLCRFRAPWLPHRLLLTCPACGIVRDAPCGTRGEIWIDGDWLIHWTGDRPAERWRGGVRVTCGRESESRTFEWPCATGTDVAAASCRMPRDVPPGPLHVSLVMIRGLKVGVYTCAWRGAPAVPRPARTEGS